MEIKNFILDNGCMYFIHNDVLCYVPLQKEDAYDGFAMQNLPEESSVVEFENITEREQAICLFIKQKLENANKIE